MKSKMRFFSMAALALAAAVLTGCTKDDVISTGAAETFSTTINMVGSDTKTTIEADGTHKFAVGDQIAIVYKNTSDETVKATSEALTVSDISADGKAAKFTVELTDPDKTKSVTYYYPAMSVTDGGVQDFSCLASQNGAQASLGSEDICHSAATAWNGSSLPTATLVSDIAILKIGSISDGSSNVTSSVTALTVSNGASTVTVSRAAGAGPIYVAVPAVTSGNLVFTAAYGSTFLVKSVSQTLDAGHLYPVNLTMFPGALPGKFSVSASKKIYFSQGNLKYDGSNWSFHANQYDRVFTSEGTATSYPMDLFTWGNQATTNYNGTGYVSGTSDLSGSTDWGNNMGAGWYTMTTAEWQYIFNTRASGSTVNSTSNARYTHATINTDGTGVNGMILFPDGVTIEASEATSWGTVNGNSSWGTKCTTAQWTALEAKGCVFLPAAGVRYYDASVNYVGIYGGYWSSTVYNDNNAYVVIFESSGLYAGYCRTRNSGYSVRLVYNAN